MSKTIHSPAARQRYLKIVKDEQDAETLVTPQGVEVPVRAKADTYLRALELGLHYVEGKPVARVEMTGDMNINVLESIRAMREQRGLPLRQQQP